MVFALREEKQRFRKKGKITAERTKKKTIRRIEGEEKRMWDEVKRRGKKKRRRRNSIKITVRQQKPRNCHKTGKRRKKERR